MTEESPAGFAGRSVWVMAKGYHPDEGGMQTYAQGVAEAWAALGAIVTVFTQTSAGPRCERSGAIELIDIGPGKSPLVPLRLFTAMRERRARVGAPALVHGTTWRTSVLPMLMGLPYVTTFHGREFMYGNTATLGLMRAAARRARLTVAVSHYSKRRLLERLGSLDRETLVAWNGLSRPAHAPQARSAEAPLLFSLCRLEPRKNIAACVRACAALHQAGIHFRYVIGGRGPELARITALVEELNLADVVEVAGYLDDARIAALHAAADIFLHPQIEVDGGRDFEGFGITIADAMAAETAVIVGSDGGTPELIEPGSTGLVIDGRDDLALQTALRRLLEDAPYRRKMAHAAGEHARSAFRWDRHVELIAQALSA
ncbi:MAG TPA: glycosyltransferase family 4 protein [Croceibacterium sp.]|nr:glycosyltransferase family 4 protein [Croceibacterium sp.]